LGQGAESPAVLPVSVAVGPEVAAGAEMALAAVAQNSASPAAGVPTAGAWMGQAQAAAPHEKRFAVALAESSGGQAVAVRLPVPRKRLGSAPGWLGLGRKNRHPAHAAHPSRPAPFSSQIQTPWQCPVGAVAQAAGKLAARPGSATQAAGGPAASRAASAANGFAIGLSVGLPVSAVA